MEFFQIDFYWKQTSKIFISPFFLVGVVSTTKRSYSLQELKSHGFFQPKKSENAMEMPISAVLCEETGTYLFQAKLIPAARVLLMRWLGEAHHFSYCSTKRCGAIVATWQDSRFHHHCHVPTLLKIAVRKPI